LSNILLATSKIVNIIVSSKFNLKIPLEKLARMMKFSIYEPEIFPGLHYRLQNNQGTIMLFASGKIVSTGTKSTAIAKNAIHTTSFEINQKLNLKLKLGQIKIENIVSTINLQTKIDLKKLTKELIGSRFNYKEFPCIFYPFEGKATLLIFNSGKIVSVGAKNETNSKNSLKFIANMLKHF
jgi:transcription initiation factor TFIID TATA-box-binding protein